MGDSILLSVKLIAATSLVVAAAVATSTFSGHRTIEELGRRDAAVQREQGEQVIVRESDLIAQKVAATVAVPLANNTYGDVQPLLDQARREAERRGDRRIPWMLVTDATGQAIAHVGMLPDTAHLAQVANLLGDIAAGEVVHRRVGADWVHGAAISIGKNPIGRLQMGVSTAALDARLAASIREVEERVQRSRRRVWLIAGLVLFAGIILAALQGIEMGRPLRVLALHAERLASGHFDERVPETRRDEIGMLAKSFNRLAHDLGTQIMERRDRAVLDRQLDLARSVQQSMLPPAKLGRHGPLKVVGHCLPASSCGGDWWTFRGLASGKLLLVVGDAAGHGLHSALVAATARGAIEALAEVDERLLSAQQVLRSIDSAIRNVGDHHVLMTCFAGLFDPESAMLHHANAGQNFPYIIRMGPGRMLEEASTVSGVGKPLGNRNKSRELRKQGSIKLNPGDLFVCFTDGLIQRQSPTGKLFGEHRLRNLLQGSVVEIDDMSLVALRDKVLAALDTFAEGTIAEDDVTFVLCQFDPPSSDGDPRRFA